MYILRIDYYDGMTDTYYCDSKEEVENTVFAFWTLEAEFSVSVKPGLVWIDWADRYDFGW